VEGLTLAKVLVLQETHIPDGETNRIKINGFNLVHHIGHNKHDLATYVSQNKSFLDIEQMTSNEHTVGIRIGNLTIFNVYKPPPSKWTAAVLPVSEHPVIYIGDFNSQNTEWEYSTNNEEGERLSDWAAINHLKLIYDAK
jgi:exonuclease III